MLFRKEDTETLTLHSCDSLGDEQLRDRLKIAIVIPHFGYGGAERMVALLASHLDLSRFDVRVFCVFGDPHNNVMERMVLHHGVPITYIRKGLGFSAKHLVRTCQELSKFGPDIVHTHLNALLYCTPWIIFHNTPMLHTLHSVPNKEASHLRQKIMHSLFRLGKAIPVTISETNRELTGDFYDICATNIEMVVNPVDTMAFQDDNPKSFDERDLDLLCVGRFSKEKNHALLLTAVSMFLDRHPERRTSFQLGLAGQGALENATKELAFKLGIDKNVQFLGVRDDIPEIMHNSKAFILTSDYEGLPMTILEAMAAGLPILATAVGGVPDVVEDGVNGMLLPPENASAIALGIEIMLSDRQMWENAGKAGIQMSKKYDSCVVAREYERLYNKYAALH